MHILPADIDISSDGLLRQGSLILQGKYLSVEGRVKYLRVKTSYNLGKSASGSEMAHTKPLKDEKIHIEKNKKIFISLPKSKGVF